jgi:hypothetical protein
MIDKNTGERSTDYIFKDWKELMAKYEANINKELETIREYKNQMLEIKQEVYKQIRKGCFIEDDQRIILSAPEIIIGHVDKSGQLISESSVITVRGTKINFEGVGTDAVVQTKANKIKSVALDPGPDGKEKVVYDDAEISSMARKITLDSDSAADAFLGTNESSEDGGVYTSKDAKSLSPGTGISIHSDSTIQVSAAICYEDLKTNVEKRLSDLEKKYEKASNAKDFAKKEIEDYVDLMEDILKTDKKIKDDDALVNVSVMALDDLRLRMGDISLAYFDAMDRYMKALSTMAESKREERILKVKKTVISRLTEEQLLKKNTGTKLYLKGEQVDVSTTDGDGKLHTGNQSSKISVNAQQVDFQSYTNEKEKAAETQFFVNFPTVQITTLAPLKEGETEQKAEGKIQLSSKNVYVHTTDIKTDGDKQKESPAKDSSIVCLSENVNLPGYDSSGKAVGTVNINGKEVNVTAINYNENLKDKGALVEDGKINVWSKALNMGSQDNSKPENCESINITTKSLTEKASESITLTQSDSTNIKVAKDKISIAAETKEFSGGKIEAGSEKAKFKETTSSSTTADNITANSQVKTPSFTN